MGVFLSRSQVEKADVSPGLRRVSDYFAKHLLTEEHEGKDCLNGCMVRVCGVEFTLRYAGGEDVELMFQRGGEWSIVDRIHIDQAVKLILDEVSSK